MIIYGDREEEVDTAEVLRELTSLCDGTSLYADAGADCDLSTHLLIRFGQLEAGLVDALCPDEDDETATTRLLRVVSIGLAAHGATPAMHDTLLALAQRDLPERIKVHAPEGFAFYSLYPEQYAEAARELLWRQSGACFTVIGIRSIGTTLSGIVAAALKTRDSFTVRPRGHPLNRTVQLSSQLEQRIRDSAKNIFVIVDEGPGLSGSSFCSVAEKLSALGIPDGHICMFPSWDAPAENLRSQSARNRWRRHEKYITPFEAVWRTDGLADVSAGQWRELFWRSERDYPAVHPQHERRKYLDRGRGILYKFAGLGSFGSASLTRALQIAQQGFGPHVLGLRNGFLETRFVEGRPLTENDATLELLDTIARYIAFLKTRYTTTEPAPVARVLEMVRVNTSEVLGYEPDVPTPVGISQLAVALDGRMLPHEWLATRTGYIKTDAVDHHDDHFFPGCQDIAWDLAGVVVEFQLSTAQREQLLENYLILQNDRTLFGRMPFYEAAYLTYRLGYAALACQTLKSSPEETRFRQLLSRYTAQLQHVLEPSHAAA
jgi:hypothetical protein